MATTNTVSYAFSSAHARSSTRDLLELVLGYTLVMIVIWSPEPAQRILAPIALVATFTVVWLGRTSRDDLGVGRLGLVPSLWILPAAVALAAVSMLAAREVGTLHSLYKGDFAHVAGYLLWTTYQQILLQDYFMPRLRRLGTGDAASVAITAILFAAAHLPNLPLTAATLVWGAVSCLLFLRYRSVYALGLSQGLLGLTFAVCLPDSLHHHLRVGLGYLTYHAMR